MTFDLGTISGLGLVVGLLFSAGVFFMACLMAVILIGQYLAGWGSGSYRRLFVEGLLEIIWAAEDDSEAKALACYLRLCVLNDEVPTAEGAAKHFREAYGARETPMPGFGEDFHHGH